MTNFKKFLAIIMKIVHRYNLTVLVYVDNTHHWQSKAESCIENINNFYEPHVKQRLSKFFIHTLHRS